MSDTGIIHANLNEKSASLSGILIRAPGIYGYTHVSQALDFGRQIRDELIHRYPLFPEAVDIFVQMASTREWIISGPPRQVPRAVDAINNAKTITFDGYVEYGFEQFLKRTSRDYICVGRHSYLWEEGGDLTYIDPCFIDFDISKQKWYDTEIGTQYNRDDVIVSHPKPIGRSGAFLSPLFSVIPTAMLAWLIREHDSAAIDGRKIRDIIVTIGQELANQMATAVEETIDLWAGKVDSASLKIPIVYVEEDEVKDVRSAVTRIGISEIPDGFDREGFQFAYVNEIASATGLPLRRIWNSEKATNRALEEVQEQRQQLTGPPVFIRTLQRLLNGRNGIGTRYGRKTRFGFVEEVDTQSRSVNAEVLRKYAEGLKIFAEVFNGQVNGKALLAWLQSEHILPEDLDLISDIGIMQSSDTVPTPDNGNIQTSSENNPSPVLQNGSEKSFSVSWTDENIQTFLDYGEMAMNGDGRVIERRNRVFSFQKVLEKALELDPEFMQSPAFDSTSLDIEDALIEARETAKARFIGIVSEPGFDKSATEFMAEIKDDVMGNLGDLTPAHHRKIIAFLEIYKKKEEENENLRTG